MPPPTICNLCVMTRHIGHSARIRNARLSGNFRGSLGVAAAGMSTPVRETSLEGPSAHGDPKVFLRPQPCPTIATVSPIWKVKKCEQSAKLCKIIASLVPIGRSFFNKGVYAFLGIAMQHILRHYLGGIGISLIRGHLKLLIKRLFSDFNC